jgi:hypothetical protein
MPFDSFKDKVFESLTLEIENNLGNSTSHYHITSIYRSPTAIQGMTTTEQVEAFLEKFEATCNYLASKRIDSYILTDSNINLLNLNTDNNCSNYLNSIIGAGYLPVNLKPTHAQNGRYSLIDHILCSSADLVNLSGSIVNDLSDHWITFAQTKLTKSKCKPQKILTRQCTLNNMTRLQNDLKNLNWADVTSCNEVDVCYDLFWDKFKLLYDLHLPLKTVKFNKNCHKISGFMTNGLLISRRKKDDLYKKHITSPSQSNTDRYRSYRNLYNKLIRASKKLHIENQLKTNKKNPKKIWDILRENSMGKKNTEKIERVMTAGGPISDNQAIANEFNRFFSSIGTKISNDVNPSSKRPEDFLNLHDAPPPPLLNLDLFLMLNLLT